MFESAELGHSIDKQTWRARVPALREALLDAQAELLSRADSMLLIIVGGVEGAGRGEVINLLNAWMDPRHIRTEAFGPPSDEEQQRPFMWRFWRALPARGEIGILFGSWYTYPITQRVFKRSSAAELDARIERIRHFERMLVAEKVVLLKMWFHLDHQTQKKRLKALSEDSATAWRVSEHDRDLCRLHKRFAAVSEQVVRDTSTADAPWVIIDGSEARYRNLTAGELLLKTLQTRPEQVPPRRLEAPLLDTVKLDQRNVINQLDYSLALKKPLYRDRLASLQRDLNLLSRDQRFRKRSAVCVFEGNDAAGKGGTIRRVTQALDARFYRVIPVSAPTDEERSRPYLWRFWRQLPQHGRFALFDRSWYGRVLVERVEGLCAEHDWMRAYTEINEFEDQLVDDGVVLSKFWLAITADEQLARFRAREATGYKRFKITDEDWRNRESWQAYESAVCDMVDRTSTEYAPWTLVEANDKRFARIKVLETLCAQLEQALA